jgi:hypothetical protein
MDPRPFYTAVVSVLALSATVAALSLRHHDRALAAEITRTPPSAEAPLQPRPPLAVEAAHSGEEPLAEEPLEPGTRAWSEVALDALEVHVSRQSHPEALRRAIVAYGNYRAQHPSRVRKPYLYFVDFGLENRTPRGYVFDMDRLALVEGPFTVAHGRGSVRGGNAAVPTYFSNVRNSNTTSLGLYLAQETYGFRGRSGGGTYTSTGLRLEGVSGRFNSAARARGIVVHGAPYVTSLLAGRSEGCPAMEPARAERLLPRLAHGGMVYHFSPLDEVWLREDPWSGERAAGYAESR